MPKCEHRYVFGTREELRARPGERMAFLHVEWSVRQAATCSVYIGPRTTVGALFVENLEPKLLSVKSDRDEDRSQGDCSAVGPP